MLKYVIQRVVLAFITLFIVLSLTYILIAALPAQKMVGSDAQLFAFYTDQVNLGFALDFRNEQTGLGERLWRFTDSSGVEHWFYKKPVFDQYISWLRNIVTKWDWGRSTSLKINYSAMGIIAEKLPTSLILNIFSVIVSVPLGILLGIIAGLKKNTKTDHIISTTVMIFISIPSFVVITFLLWILSYQLGWLPTQWPSKIAPIEDRIRGFIIPVLSLSFGSICGYCRFVRAELCEVMSSEYLLLARTKGLTKNQAITRHALKNAFVPIVETCLGNVIDIRDDASLNADVPICVITPYVFIIPLS
jgi:oligopeptide transport system permease protein